MEEARPVRKLVPSLCDEKGSHPEETLALVRHSCNGKHCDVLLLRWSTLLGETFGECFQFFRGIAPPWSLVAHELRFDRSYRH